MSNVSSNTGKEYIQRLRQLNSLHIHTSLHTHIHTHTLSLLLYYHPSSRSFRPPLRPVCLSAIVSILVATAQQFSTSRWESIVFQCTLFPFIQPSLNAFHTRNARVYHSPYRPCVCCDVTGIQRERGGRQEGISARLTSVYI